MPTDPSLMLERSVLIAAPRDVVFRYFTDSRRFAAWWGEGSQIDAKPGGVVKIVYPNRAIASGVVVELKNAKRKERDLTPLLWWQPWLWNADSLLALFGALAV